MKISERVELYYLQKYASKPRKIKPVQEIAEICVSCAGRCKAEKGLTVCGRQTREKAKRDGKR